MQIRLRPRVREPDTIEREAGAEERRIPNFVGGVGAEVEAYIVDCREDCFADCGLGVPVEAGGEFADEIGVSSGWLFIYRR